MTHGCKSFNEHVADGLGHVANRAIKRAGEKITDHFMPADKRHKTSQTRGIATGPDGGGGSTGDMNKVLFRAKKMNKRKMNRQKKFIKKVKEAIDLDFPLVRTLFQTSAYITTVTGTQGVSFIDWNSVSDMRKCLSLMNNSAQSLNDYIERFDVKYSRIEGQYSNSGNSLAIMDWYLVVSRIDNVASAYGDFANQGNNTTSNGGETVSLASNTFQSSLPTINTVGVTPFNFTGFTSKWKIINKRRVMLQPGETKEFRHYQKGNKRIEGSHFASNLSGINAMKGWTKAWILVAYGQPTHDGTTETLVTTAPVRIDIAYTKTYETREGAPSLVTGANTIQAATVNLQATNFNAVTTPKVVEEFNPSTVVTATAN